MIDIAILLWGNRWTFAKEWTLLWSVGFISWALLEIGEGQWVATPWKKHSLTTWSYHLVNITLWCSQLPSSPTLSMTVMMCLHHFSHLFLGSMTINHRITLANCCTGCSSVAKCVLILIFFMVYQFLAVASILISVHIYAEAYIIIALKIIGGSSIRGWHNQSHVLSHVDSPHWCWCNVIIRCRWHTLICL